MNRTFLRKMLGLTPVWLVLCLALAPRALGKTPPPHPVNLNTATIQELEQLPGVGLTTAKAIVQCRAKSGPFRRVEDLLAIRGISAARLEKLRPYVAVSSPGKKVH